MGVTEITNFKQYMDALDATTDEVGDSKKPLMIIDCYATWCPPCRAIAPKFEEYSDKYTQAAFYKVNVDEVEKVAMELGVRSMPTFIYFQDGIKVEEVVGAAPQRIEETIVKFLE